MTLISSLVEKQIEVEWNSYRALTYRKEISGVLPSLHQEISDAGIGNDQKQMFKFIANHPVFRIESQVPIEERSDDVIGKETYSQNEVASKPFKVNFRKLQEPEIEKKPMLTDFVVVVERPAVDNYVIDGLIGAPECRYSCTCCSVTDMTSSELLSHCSTSSHTDAIASSSTEEDVALIHALRSHLQLQWSSSLSSSAA
eukprot:TRINITY_DN3478_c0_g1_i2.p1 TRINITY_DN3478_c0_g1~~TRINITY_DN3478_c0_g1_i2.p1  ORF type:complete len:199 (+),score=16.73 TRINITY_DN3478_c0_g1_i2:603-1199(+)